MNTSIFSKAVSVGFLSALMSLSAIGQGLPAGVTQEMIEQVKSMPPEQQKALAQQYGVPLPQGSNSPAILPNLARPGINIEAPRPSEKARAESLPPQTGQMSKQVRSRYGQSLFNQDVSTFAPTDDAPVPDSYRLGVGDQLVVQLFGKENELVNLQIGRSGDVSFPKLGSIPISGLTFEDARDLIKTRISQELIGVEAVISMGRLRAINVFMAGEVSVPGAYSISALATVSQALFQAGGVTDIGSLRNIQVRRNGRIFSTFDTYDLLMRGDATRDIRLQSGDVVFVPPYGGVAEMTGELKRPMLYELVGGETIKDLLVMAGSFTSDAFPALSVMIRRSDVSSLSEASTLNLLDSEQLNTALRDGDIIRVPKKGSLVTKSVKITGAVTRPGSYGWRQNMRVSDLIGDARSDLDPRADLGVAIIIRQKEKMQTVAVLSFNVLEALEAPGSDLDPVLYEYDEVLIFADAGADFPAASRVKLLEPLNKRLVAQADSKQAVQSVSVSGGVRAPGVYPLVEGASLDFLIRIAGGLTEAAYSDRGELRSLSVSSGGEVEASYRDITLDDEAFLSKISLRSRDHLTVREIPNWSPESTILLQGEFVFPGEYQIRAGERLSEVIKRAGGTTSKAHIDAAVFRRQSIAELEVERAKRFADEITTTYATRLLTEENTSRGIAEVSEIVASLQAVEGEVALY